MLCDRKGFIMNNLKVGIITFYNVLNYGANLQCFALMNKIEQWSCNASIINYANQTSKYANINSIIKKIYVLIVNFLLLPLNLKIKRNFKIFQNQYYNLSKVVTTKEELENLLNEYDYVITGSDQVWNEEITQEDFDIYMLKLKDLSGNKKISYAASIGKDNIEKEKSSRIANAVKDYKAISVREKSAKDILNNEGINNVEIVLDPVLLHTQKEWNSVRKSSNSKEKYIFVYMLLKDYKLIEFVEHLADKTQYRIVHMDRINRYNRKYRPMSKYGVGPDEFVDLIANAEYVVMNSFHGLAFSILYEKQFVVFPHNTRNTRIENLLDITNLRDRMITSKEYNIEDYINEKIDYEEVNKRLEVEREKSINFLKKALGDNNE